MVKTITLTGTETAVTGLDSASDYLKEHPEYKNESTSTYSRTYSAYNIIPN